VDTPARRLVATVTAANALREAWLTSGDHYFWNIPRRVQVHEPVPGPELPSEYVRLDVPDSEPDGPMMLLVTRRDGGPWHEPEQGEAVHVLLWEVSDPASVWANGRAHPPTPRPTAWCSVTRTAADAQDVATGNFRHRKAGA